MCVTSTVQTDTQTQSQSIWLTAKMKTLIIGHTFQQAPAKLLVYSIYNFFLQNGLDIKKTNISGLSIQHSNKLIKCHLEKLPLVFSCKHVRCFLTQMFANMTLTMPLGLFTEYAEGAEGFVFTQVTRPVNI